MAQAFKPQQAALAARMAGAAIDARIASIQRAPVFCGLSMSECAQIAAAAEERRLARGDLLFREGDPVRHVSLLAAGRMKVTQLGPGGQQVILRLKVPGEIVSELGLPHNSLHSSTAQALDAASILGWTVPAFEALGERFSVLHRNMVRLLADRLQQIEERFREMATERVAPRLARTLIRLLQHVGHPAEGGIRIGLSRDELAQMTGTTLFTVSRLLSDWEDEGIVGNRREAVLVFSTERLVALTQAV